MKTDNPELSQQPPQLTQRFLTWCLPSPLKEPIVGDLAEEYLQKIETENELTAMVWYHRQAFKTAIRFLWQSKRGVLMFILGLLTFLATLTMAIMFSGEWSMFVNVPSLLLVIPPAVFLTIGICSGQTCKTAIRLLFDNELELSISELKAARNVYVILGNSCLWLGWMGMLIGAVAVAINMEVIVMDTMLGPAIGICLLTLMYGLIPKVLCYIGEQKIQHLILRAEG